MGIIGNDVYGIDFNAFEECSASIKDTFKNINIVDSSGQPTSYKVKFEIESSAVAGENDGDPGELIIKLRLLDYCDKDGNEQKILVLASQPF
jgi:hypothetical protein